MPKEKDLFAIRRTKWQYIKVDEYTAELVNRVVESGKARSTNEAVGRSASLLLGERYKTSNERKLEGQISTVHELAGQISQREHRDTADDIPI